MTLPGIHAIHLALAEQFKFNFEVLGLTPHEEDHLDIHAVRFLNTLPGFQAQDLVFGENKHVHFNRHLAYGAPVTGYPLPNGTLMDHHFTYETYECIWPFALFEFSAISQTAPWIFSTQRNYFMECCNGTFLHHPDYKQWPGYPIASPEHASIFTESGCSELGLSSLILTPGFDIPALTFPSTTLATLHFCQQLLFSALVLLWGVTQLFGPKLSQAPEFMSQFWHPNTGEAHTRYTLYDRHMLAYLYLTLHPAATLLAYGVYRDKYGVINSHRTTLFVMQNNQPVSLKQLLKSEIQSYLTHIGRSEHPKSDIIITQARSAILLGQLFGIGYQTEPQKGQNPHWNVPHEFDAPWLQARGHSTRVHHDPSSPLWRLFYDYAGDWWTVDQIWQIISGAGPEWLKMKPNPRANAIQVCHRISAQFWHTHLDKIQTPAQRQTCIHHLKRLHLI